MRQLLFISSILFLLLNLIACSKKDGYECFTENLDLKLIDDIVVYDNNNHVAFTCLRKYKDDYYLAFREGNNHRPMSKDEYGKIVLLRFNKCKWEKIAVLADNDKDLRDPYLLVKDNKLIIYCGYNKIKDNTYAHAVQRIAFFKRVVIILL